MEDIVKKSDTADAISAGLMLSEIRAIDGTPIAVLPEGAQVHELERMLVNPTRKRGATHLTDAASFIAFVKAEKTAETRVYLNTAQQTFVAIFNDHGASAGWRDHRAVYACPLSIEWKIWINQNGKQVDQVAFAQFIESNLPDIADPPAADMLEISRSLEAKKKVNFSSGIRLSNGQNELTYEEEISGTAAKGKLQVPEIFTIGIPVLEGGQRYAVQARLRYRIRDGGQLTIWYELIRPHKVIEDAMNELRASVGKELELTVLAGSA